MTGQTKGQQAKPGHNKHYPVHIDKKPYKTTERQLTGTEIRDLPDTPIGPEFDLWLEVPGDEDQLIADDQVVAIREGVHFFTAPRQINPGGC